ncbi:MAG: 50S ribosomal protein L7 [Oscillibacter sp.]|nr:50S ribosomal protein L7 [Oscillibacter sp.]
MSNDALLMTGMALRAGRLEVGDEAAGDACQCKRCRLLLVAADAGESARRRAARFAEEGQCLLAELPCSREELGAALGRKSCAMAAVTDLGLARAIVERLAQADPEAFGETAERLRLKAARAARRKEKKPGDPRRKKTAGRPVQYNRKHKK